LERGNGEAKCGITIKIKIPKKVRSKPSGFSQKQHVLIKKKKEF
jgi:hypothetical protein